MNDTASPEHQLIGHLYDVAVDPGHYEAMIDHWETMLRPALEGQMAGATDPHDLVGRHVLRADRVLEQVLMTPQDDGAAAQVERIRQTACFTVDGRGHMAAVNNATTLMFGLTAGARARDLPLARGEADKLITLAASLLQSNAPISRVLCLRLRETGRLLVLQLRLCRPPTEAAFVLCVTSEIHWPDGFAQLMEDSFGLSPSEIEVLRFLAEGLSVADIAAQRRRSLETVRVQLKSLQSRTGTRSQQELIRLALTTLNSLRDQALPASERRTGPAEVETRRFALKGGRQMEYLVFGNPEGRPVLFLPLDMGFVRWPPKAEADALRRGLRIIVPIRAGYGGSSPAPARSEFFRQFISDHLDLLDHLRIPRLPILTLGDDSLLAIRLYAAAPQRFSALLACAGALPLTSNEQIQRMGKWHRFILGGARLTPHLLPFMVRAGAAMARRYGKTRFLASVFSSSPADAATFAIPDVAEAMIVGSEVMLSADHCAAGPFAQSVAALAQADWTGPMAQLRSGVENGRMKVQFFSGEQDPQTPQETMVEQRDEHPWIEFTVYPDAGQLLFFLKWRDVIARLDEIA